MSAWTGRGGLHPRVIGISVSALVLMTGAGVVAPILPLFAQEFGVSYAGAGALISAFAVGRIPFDIVGGGLADRLSPRWVAALGAALVAVAALLSGLAENFRALLLYRVMDGAGSAIFVVTAMSFLVRTVPPAHMGKAMSLYQGTVLLGVSVGPAIGGTAASVFHSLRAPFFIMALLASGVCCLALVWIREPPAQSGCGMGAPTRGRTTGAGPDSRLAALLGDSTFLFACALTTLVFAVRGGIRLNLIPLLGRDVIGLDEAGIGLILSLSALANVAVLWHAGSLIDRLGRRRVAMPSLCVSLLVVVSFIWAKTFFSLLAAAAALGAVMGYLAPAPAAMVADLASPGVAGAAMGVYRVAGDLGLLVGPVSAGWVAGRFGFTAAFLFAGACGLLVLLAGRYARETLGTPGTGEAEPTDG